MQISTTLTDHVEGKNLRQWFLAMPVALRQSWAVLALKSEKSPLARRYGRPGLSEL